MSEKAYNIKFTAIELLSKSITESPSILEPNESFTFNFSVEIRVSPETKTAGTVVSARIILVKENKEVASFKILCVFELPDFDLIFTKNEEKIYNVPIQLEIILKSAGLSTLRGIMAAEVRGTYLHGTVLPFIDINTIVRNERKEEIKK